MANNQQYNTSGLRHRKSAKKNDGEYNNAMQQGNNPNPPQMMGWMPPYQQVGGWMPQPGMQPYPPQMMGWQQPQYPNWGWMPAQPMQQPIMMAQPPAANNRGFAPSHNGNIQDVMQINELDDVAKPIKHKVGATAAANADIDMYTESDDYEDIEDIEYIEDIPEPNYKKHTKKPMQSATAPRVEKKQKQKQDIQLVELFDNTLDDIMQSKQQRRENYTEFGPESDANNVIAKLTPVDKQHAHFDSTQFPDELYNLVMYHGNAIQLPAKDISSDALETGKIVYRHNEQLANQLAASGQQSAGEAFIYTRSSRTNDISIETQRKACLQYAAVHKLKLLPFGYQSDNNISARNMNNLKHELGFWQEHIPDGSNIIIYSIDRLSRHLIKGMQYLDEMAARGIRIHFVTHELVFHSGISAAGRAMIQQELQSAEKFSNIASEKVRTTMARLRREGNVFGRAPYGYRHTKLGNIRKRVPDNKEQQNIKKIKAQSKFIIDNWKNMPETAEIRYSKINMVRALSRWCIRSGLQYRNAKNYTTSQIQKIIALENNAN